MLISLSSSSSSPSLPLLLLILLLAISGFASASITYTAEAEADRVDMTLLPGADNLLSIPFATFSGYLDIDGVEPNSKRIHYWFVESAGDTSIDPVTFWTNGGPGCSGMLGMMTEQGPFKLSSTGTLSLNPYGWNTLSNMLFVESPCGVGFSYSTLGGLDYNSSDSQSAKDNYNVIQKFFFRYPHLSNNDFYITSESWGGHYIPYLAREILKENLIMNDDSTAWMIDVRLKGFAVGNPYTDIYSGSPAMLDTLNAHSLIPKPLWDAFKHACPLVMLESTDHASHACDEAFEKAFEAAEYRTNLYALDWPTCDTGRPFKKQRERLLRTIMGPRKAALRESRLSRRLHVAEVVEGALRGSVSGLDLGVGGMGIGRNLATLDDYGAEYEPCEDGWLVDWMNKTETKAALHVKTDREWAECASENDKYPFHYNQSDYLTSTAPFYKDLIELMPDMKILVYSGTDDSVCATYGTQRWIWNLGYEVDDDVNWAPYVIRNQTAGHITAWKNTNLVFATVLNAGHEVPTYKNVEGFSLWKAFLKGNLKNLTLSNSEDN